MSESLLLDDEGKPEGLITVVRDITEQEKIKNQLSQAQKMETVGQLTGGIAHDFNNLLTVILGNLSLIERQKGLDEKLEKRITRIRHAAERGVEMTRRLLGFSRQQRLETTEVDINGLVTGMHDMISRTLGEHISLETKTAEKLPHCETDAGQLENALLNLCVNARDAMPEGGLLTIETSLVNLDEAYVAKHVELTVGTYILLAVSDTGSGMPPEVIEKVFEPFFTTKETGKGTGLGLSMVYGFMKQSGGNVTIYSEEGEGTTIRLYIPVVEAAAGAIAQQADKGGEPAAEEINLDAVILFVEDDPDVKEIGVEILSDMGLKVHDADDGPSALALLEKLKKLDLLITDMIMPGGMRGDEVADAVRKLHPQVKVIFMSGYAEEAVNRSDFILEGDLFISKPYQPAELIEKVGSSLS